ncbi:uncharacterized protein LOC111643770 [Copidosoma floridanum]|uniref:uncharacterized protein LOC111643770 n=1 Tax=Copidosoma floridanum TaxID=29053 RepID=UPI000C6F4DDB|nr:uncharacterized protein LOC111643770 [Copidosoma floridanum]
MASKVLEVAPMETNDLVDQSVQFKKDRKRILSVSSMEDARDDEKQPKSSRAYMLNNSSNINQTTEQVNLVPSQEAREVNFDKQSRSAVISTYASDDKGPLGVIIQSKKVQGQRAFKSLNRYSISKSISKKYSVNQIFLKSSNKIEVIFNSREDANNVLTDQEILDKDCDIFIPFHWLVRKGIIRGVDLDVEEKDILQDLKSSIKIHSVRRITRKNPKADSDPTLPKYIPTKSIIVTFHGQELPQYVFMYHIAHEVQPFISTPRICYSCFLPGHMSKVCKSSPMCGKCGENKHENACKLEVLKCATCGSPHRTLDASCPTMIKERAILRVMALENKPHEDARKIVFGTNRSNNVIASKEAFPSLNNEQPFSLQNRFQPLVQEQFVDSDEVPYSFSQALLNKPKRRTNNHLSQQNNRKSSYNNFMPQGKDYASNAQFKTRAADARAKGSSVPNNKSFNHRSGSFNDNLSASFTNHRNLPSYNLQSSPRRNSSTSTSYSQPSSGHQVHAPDDFNSRYDLHVAKLLASRFNTVNYSDLSHIQAKMKMKSEILLAILTHTIFLGTVRTQIAMNLSSSISYQVGEDKFGSDHFPICFEVNTAKYVHVKRSFKISSVRTDWN